MNQYLDLNANVLDDSALLILQKINSRPSDTPITLYELLDIHPIENAIAAYKKILELDSYNYLRMTVDQVDNRVHYVSLTDKSFDIFKNNSEEKLTHN